jgi:hypothetical protein
MTSCSTRELGARLFMSVGTFCIRVPAWGFLLRRATSCVEAAWGEVFDMVTDCVAAN